jgi:hypothetical protein
MNYETVKTRSDEDFKRAVGVQRRPFEKRLTVVEQGIRPLGRPRELSRADP